MKQTSNEVKTTDLRANLKQLFAEEIKKMPEYLQGMEPKEKFHYLLKLMPFILPKVDAVHYTNGEGEWEL